MKSVSTVHMRIKNRNTPVLATQPKLRAFALVSAAALAACGTDNAGNNNTDPDAGVTMDASATADAGTLSDAGVAIDAGMSDAGVMPPPAIQLVSVEALATLVASDAVQVVDVRSRSAFDAAHVAGAVHLPTNGLRGTVGGVSGQVVARAVAEGIFETAGVDSSRELVVVGSANDTTTSRAAWTLALYGAQAGVSLLDGGMAAWVADGRDVETEDTASPSIWQGAATVEQYRVDKAWVLAHLDDTDVQIFDVRTSGEYAGGHIPGAQNVDWTGNLNRSGLFLDAAAIRTRHGDPTAPTLVVYCQSGARASVTWTLLKALEYEDVRLYDGSWAEWGSDPTTPKE